MLVSELFLTSLFSGQGYVAPEFGFKMTMIIIIIINLSLYTIKGSVPVLNSLLEYLLSAYRVSKKLLGVIHKFE